MVVVVAYIHHGGCCTKFDSEYYQNTRDQYTELTHDQLDLLIIGCVVHQEKEAWIDTEFVNGNAIFLHKGEKVKYIVNH